MFPSMFTAANFSVQPAVTAVCPQRMQVANRNGLVGRPSQMTSLGVGGLFDLSPLEK